MTDGADATPVPAFHRAGVRWLAAAVGLSLLVSAVLVVFGYDFEYHRSAMNDSFSNSALGHRGWRGLLQRLGTPVLSARNRASRRAADQGVLIVAEPESREGLRSLLLTAGAGLVVLPKWKGAEDPRAPGWLKSVAPKTDTHVESVLDAITEEDEALTLVRAAGPMTGWRSRLPGAEAPDLLFPQLIKGEGLDPLISCDQGVLLGTIQLPDAAGPTYILADPDLIANHGLLRGANAVIAVRIVEAARSGLGGPVAFDETIHGHTAHPSVFRELFRYPLILVTAQVLLLGAVVGWLALVRFGAPVAPGVRLGAGKRYLIDHLAAVQRLNGHTPAALRRYYRSTVQLVARRLNVPAHLEGAALEQWVARSEAVRQPAQGLARLRQTVAEAESGGAPQRCTAAARAIHRWREEMLHGS